MSAKHIDGDGKNMQIDVVNEAEILCQCNQSNVKLRV